jgi:hypothetical protein
MPAPYDTRARARVLLIVGACVGCGSSKPPGVDAQPLTLGPLMPQEVAGSATAIIASPTVVAITYDGDPQRTDVEAFYPQFAASPAWATQTSEYGVGALAVGSAIHLTGSAAGSDAAIRALLAANLGSAASGWGPPSEDKLYSFTLPLDTPFVDSFGMTCCGGYHDDVLVGSADVAYAVQCPCSNNFPPPVTKLQALTFGLSHELVEGVTDPRYEHQLGWGAVDDAHQVWAYVTDGELGDLCEFVDTALWSDAPGMTYTLARIWSNRAALAGTDPCVGAPTAPYAQSVPDQTDATTIDLFGATAATSAVKIAMGATGAITVHVAGTGPGPFTVTAVDVASALFGAGSPLLSFTQPTGTYVVGDVVTIAVTPIAADANLGGAGAEAFEIDTKPAGGGPSTYFYGLVSQ